MNVRVLKINESLFVGEAQAIVLPGISGDMQILAGHESLATILKAGTVTVTDMEKKEHTIKVEHGYAEVTPDQVTVLL